jgi:tetratricopeptide (TPR) repeat protein
VVFLAWSNSLVEFDLTVHKSVSSPTIPKVLTQFIVEISQDQNQNLYPLSPLSEADIEHLLNACGRASSDAKAIAKASGGLAQYVIELLNAPDGKITDDLNEVLRQRLHRAYDLDPNAKALLEAVAVLSPHASSENVRRVTDLSISAFNAALLEMVAFDVLTDGSSIRFVSRLMRDQTLRVLSQDMHDELHRHCAEHLSDQPSLAALHYRAARSHKRTWNDKDPQAEINAYRVAASEYALRSGKLKLSLNWLQAAEAIGNISNDQRVLIRTDRARILEWHGQHQSALDRLAEIEPVIDLVQNPEIKAAYLSVYANILALKTEQLGKAQELANRAEQVLLGSGNNTPTAQLIISDAQSALGTVARRQEQFATAKTHFQQSLGLRSLFDDQKRRYAAALNNLGIACDMLGESKDADRHYRECIKHRIALGDDIGLVRTLNNLGNLHHKQGQYEEAQNVLRQALERSRAIGDAWLTSTCLLSLGINAWLQHQLQTALVYANEALLEAKNHPEIANKARYNLAELYYLLGDEQSTRQTLVALNVLQAPTMLETNLRADDFLLAAECLHAQDPDQAKRIAEGVLAHSQPNSSVHCRAAALLAAFNRDTTHLQIAQACANNTSLKPILEYATGLVNNAPATLQAGLECATELLDIYRFLRGLILLEPANKATWEAKIQMLRNPLPIASEPITA